MNRSLAAFLEYGLLFIVFIVLVAFIGPPDFSKRPQPATPPATPMLSQASGPAPWDMNLRLPAQSDRTVRYTMNVKLNTETNIIGGSEVLEWRNNTGRAQNQFPFHLYHNAWKNNRSTFAKESGYNLRGRAMEDKDYGYTNVKKVVLLDARGETDITNTFQYIQPDDNNTDDQSVFQITTPRSVPPNGVLRLRIEFETKQPIPIARTGAIRDYHFVVQWFPKIGVWWKGAWNCHQFHANTEFFADFGVYDVSITVPSGYVIGATGGNPKEEKENSDGTTTYRFYQEDVHDFAWVTAPDIVKTVRTFSHKELETGERPDRHHPLKDVTVILLSQPHHANMIDRYFTATFNALRYYGEWYGQYPYDAVTVVDPANDSRSGGMEYPTLFTGGTNMFSPVESASPEGVTVHEFGHQFWYGLIGNNEFEEAWLDEGFNTYSTSRVIDAGWPSIFVHPSRFYFGGGGAGSFVGIPYVIDDVYDTDPRAGTNNLQIKFQGKNDVMMRRGWEYHDSYGLNSYTKPGTSLLQLERFLGEETMYRIMRTYHHRFRFQHPTSQDFINVVNEVAGKNMNWFFENTWFSSNLFDYSIDAIRNTRVPPPAGLFNNNGAAFEPKKESGGNYECMVVVKREGEAVTPVDVLVVFENGDQKRETWDGQYRWRRFVYRTDSPVKYAVVDPDKKIAMDINYNNNGKSVPAFGSQSLAARKLASKWMFWMQMSLEYASFWN